MMMVKSTRNICAHCHTHPSFRSCKFVCLNLYRDRASSGDPVASDNLPWAREHFDKTRGLLESLNNPTNNDKFAFPRLQSLYDGNSMEELFDSSNKPSPVSLSSRRFIGNLVYKHFGNSWVQKPNLSLLLCHSIPIPLPPTLRNQDPLVRHA